MGLYFTSQSLITTQQQSRATQDQVRLAEMSQKADRFTKAIDQLGSERLDIRVGAVFAFDVFVRNSPEYYRATIQTLASFIRIHAPAGNSCSTLRSSPADIEAAMLVIGRNFDDNKYRGDSDNSDLFANGLGTLDLSDTCLRGMYLPRINLTTVRLAHADFSFAHLVGARFDSADMEEADFSNADVSGAHFDFSFLTNAHLVNTRAPGSVLEGAHLDHADLSHGSFPMASFRDCTMTGIRLTGGDFRSADLTGVDLSGVDRSGANFTAAIGIK
ncbi:pentapeptide repeat-containing protein [Kibdelosporangium lantanae]|uniref:Pentapeptide repeat-containing protein n=1 Tax=Kibdelosporangium lantanae TaxID=1497396 RepID=A0ABW3M3M7_9PSEU